jgi:hypothetical protein
MVLLPIPVNSLASTTKTPGGAGFFPFAENPVE